MGNNTKVHTSASTRSRKGADTYAEKQRHKRASAGGREAPDNRHRLQPQPQHGHNTGQANGCTIEAKIKSGEWWPFDRVDSKTLNKLHQESIMNIGEALW